MAPEKTDRRDALIAIEKQVQAKWEKAKLYEVDAPDDPDQPKYFATFPYPYMNGILHLGHAFTLEKVDIACRYQRLLGKKVLFPFGFHCTGAPISAAAAKLRREIIEFGNPPVFPIVTEEEEEKKKDVGGGEPKIKKKGKVAKKKSKHNRQWKILLEMGVPEAEVPRFQDPSYWLNYFPPFGQTHLKQFGMATDWRRSFITTDANPYYDAFIRWQFNTLKSMNKVKFGKRLSIFSPLDNQVCADHDRSEGEGVGITDYALIKIELLKPYPAALKHYENTNQKIFLPAGTMRPETMYGQTNCFVLPDGEYGVFQITADEIFVMSDRSALNMTFQEIAPASQPGKPNKLGAVKGWDLLGCAIKAPLSTYEKMYVYPLMTIKMDKGTAVVTSVPSDAPDDWAALMDLKKKKPMREKFNLTDEMVLPFEVVPIIEIPGLGKQAAADLCVKEKVKSQNDAAKLAAIKDKCYLEGFSKGVMLVGEFKGRPVKEAKPLIKEWMMKEGLALPYSEPEGTVVSRTGDPCVVALVDQWYIDYGEEHWKSLIEHHVHNVLETYNPKAKEKFVEMVDWLRDKACSRSHGLGTKLPWDTQFVIESLSDSTIYMAYYTIANQLQGGHLNGDKMGSAKIPADKMTDEVFDYIFRQKEFPGKCGIKKSILDGMKKEFEFWYPMDLRVSAKDLIGNHLTMALYNHAAIWEGRPELWPRSYFTNGHLMINAEKMSKSTGNFMTLIEALQKFGVDACRLALADAGDSMLDANFEATTANAAILKLTTTMTWVNELLAQPELLRDGPADLFMDKVFDNEMNTLIAKTKQAYDNMTFHDVVKHGYFELWGARDTYRANLTEKPHRALIMRFIEAAVIMLSPICPHWTQHVWETLGKSGFVVDAPFPHFSPEDELLSEQVRYLSVCSNSFRSALTKQQNTLKKNAAKRKEPEPAALDTAVIQVASSYPEWQQKVLSTLKQLHNDTGALPDRKGLAKTLAAAFGKDKKMMKNAMAFAAGKLDDYKTEGVSALATQMAFDEKKFIDEHIHFLTRGMGLKHITVDVVEATNDKNSATPGKPKPVYSTEGVAAFPSTEQKTETVKAQGADKKDDVDDIQKRDEKPRHKKQKKSGKKKKKSNKKQHHSHKQDHKKHKHDIKHLDEKQIKKAVKEGGKKGQDIAGLADMGGVCFFHVSLESPQGNMKLMNHCLEGFNKVVDENADDRKGGAGSLAKVLFSYKDPNLIFCMHVPKEQQGKVEIKDWFQVVLDVTGGKVTHTSADGSVMQGTAYCDPDKGQFAIKIRDDAIQKSYQWLREKQLVIEDDSDDDIVYGDDDFPDYYEDAETTAPAAPKKIFTDIDNGKTTGQEEFKTWDNDAIIGQKMPSLYSLQYLKEAAPTDGQVSVFVLWAQYHKPGYKFLPLYSQLQAKYGSKVAVVGVSVDPDVGYPTKFLADPAKKYSTVFPCDFAVAWDTASATKQALMKAGNLVAFSPPHAYLVDANGTIVWHQDHSELGATAPSYLGLMEDQIDALLAGEPLKKVGDKKMEEYVSEGEEAVDIDLDGDGSDDDAFAFL